MTGATYPMSFEPFGLEAEILRAISAQGYPQATPIQQRAIPAILDGKDLMAGAQTGTEKPQVLPCHYCKCSPASPSKVANDPCERS